MKVLLTQQKFIPKLSNYTLNLIDIDTQPQQQYSLDNLHSKVHPLNLAYVIYTSGSTGRPKGVAIAHRNTVALLHWASQVFSQQDLAGVLAATSICFDLSVFELFMPLSWGGKVILCENALSLPKLESADEVTLINTVPSAMAELVRLQAVPSSVRTVNLAGEPLPRKLVEQIYQIPTVQRVLNLYGPSEDTTYSTWEMMDKHQSQTPTIGRAIANTQVYLLDEQLQPVPVGVVGQLYLGGHGLARGYLNRGELTAQKFIPNPFSQEVGSRLYQTGDLARYKEDGNLEFLGRVDHQVKIRGFRIEIGEIETVLGTHPTVAETVVIPREDVPGNQRLVAYVVLKERTGEQRLDSLRRPDAGGAEEKRSRGAQEQRRTRKEDSLFSSHSPTPLATTEGTSATQWLLPIPHSLLKDFLKQKLPNYMVPSAIVLLEALPLTPNGKIDRRALPAPDTARQELTPELVTNQTPTQEILTHIWADILGVQNVGVHDNFFELGGHSLLATQLFSRLRDTFAVELSLREVFESPTVAELAECIENAHRQQDWQLPPLVPVARDIHLPLSFAQKRLWFLDQLEPGSFAYNMAGSVRLTGALDLAILECSLHNIILRHEALRTTFVTVNGEPVQAIAPTSNFSLSLINLQHLSPNQQQTQIQELATIEAREPFDLRVGPLLRATVLVLDDQEHILLLTMHHIISDGWSIGILIRELAALYDAYTLGQAPTLAELPIQYADFAHWQRQWLTGEVLQAQLDYWKQQLAHAPSLLELPTDRPRPAVQTFRGASQSLVLPPSLSQELKNLSRRNGVTLFMTLLAAFQTLLYRYTGTEDICVGTPIANRNHSQTEGLIGFFVNTLVLRTNLSGNLTFLELLERVREVALGAYAHQDLPFEQLVEVLQPERSLSHHPLFQVMFVLQNTPMPVVQLGGLTLSPVEVDAAMAKFDVTLSMEDTSSGLIKVLEYNTDLFDAQTISRMLGHFQTILFGIVADPQQQVRDLPLLTAAEHEQLLVKWNHTQQDYPQHQCIHQLFEAQVAKTPNAVAVVSGDEQLTYSELNCRANSIAHYLKSKGVTAETLVGVCAERSPLMIAGLLGILKAGAAYVPIDPAYPSDRIAFTLEDAQIQILLTQHQLSEKTRHTASVVCLDSDWHVLAQYSQDNLTTQVTPKHLAYTIYTSGSTGKPKGVQIQHGGLVNLVSWHQQVYSVTSADRATHLAGVAFDASVWELWSYLTAGSSIFIPAEQLRLSPSKLVQWLGQQRITISFLPTPLAEAILEEDLPPDFALRYLLTGGDRLHQKADKDFTFTLVNHYGPTENTVVATSAPVTKAVGSDALPPIGRPIANTQVYLLDSELKPVPVGVLGELCISGVGLARGYLNRPELTAEKFIPNPFSNQAGTRLYKTGDLARYLEDGNIEFLGRVDDQVKIRGFRIELGEIEAVLAAHPAVKETVVLTQENEVGNKRLVAYVVTKQEVGEQGSRGAEEQGSRGAGEQRRRGAGEQGSRGAEAQGSRGAEGEYFSLSPLSSPSPHSPLPTTPVATLREAALRASTTRETRATHWLPYSQFHDFLKQRLPEYMVPSVVILLEALPLTANGKVDRRALPIAEFSRTQLSGEFVAPRTPTEEILTHIWTNVLGVERVGVYDNFFELGGHSLLATQLFSRVRDTFGVELPLRELFTSPTIAGLGECIERARRNEQQWQIPPLVPVERDRNLPLSFAQTRLWFLDQLESGGYAYNIPGGLRLTGELDLEALSYSLNEIVRRHEVLRTNFKTVNGEPVQAIASTSNFTISVVNLQQLPPKQQQLQVAALLASEVREPFKLSNGSLLRAKVVELGEKEHVLLLTMHHIVSDGWSIGIVLRELATLYNAYSQGESSPLPELPIQYADFAFWQRQWLVGEVLQAQLNYWKQHLANAPSLLELPTDRPRPRLQTFRGGTAFISIGESVTQQLRNLSQRFGVTLFMTLLAAFQTLLYRYTGTEDICVGTPIANRNHSQTERLIGFFVNTLVLRTNLGDNPSFTQLLQRVREVALGAYAHQDLPFEQLVEALQPERSLSHHPLFQVMFVLQNAPMPVMELPGLSFTPLESNSTTAKFDLTLSMEDTPQGLLGALEYNTDLFDAQTIERILENFQTLLDGIVANPQQTLQQLPVLTAAQRQQLLFEWNQTQQDYPRQDECIHQLFETQVEKTPHAVAVVFENEQLTYSQLNHRANCTAHYLQTLGVRANTVVGVCVERSLEMVVAVLGILKAGGAYLPLDPAYPSERLAYMLSDGQVGVLLTHPPTSTKLPPHGCRIVDLERDWSVIAQHSHLNPRPVVGSNHLAYVIYTSGSTGKPKGVMIPHGAICNHMLWMQSQFPFTATDCVLQKTPFSFDASVWEFYAPLLSGGVLVMAQPLGHQDPHYLADVIQSQQITNLQLVPSLLQVLLAEKSFADCSSLERVFCGGEALSYSLVERLLGQLNLTVHNLYGPTETCIDVTFYSCNCEGETSSLVPIGRPIANTQVYILDSELQPVPIGVKGELYIGGAGLAVGYLGRPDLTAEKFLPHPFSQQPGHRLYKTGDLVRYRGDGNIEYLGRSDHQLKLRGFRIEIPEIEAVLATHPALQEAVVMVREDVPGDQRLVAYVVFHHASEHGFLSSEPKDSSPHSPTPLATTEGTSATQWLLPTPHSLLRDFLHQKLPEYMIPSAFLVLENLPVLPNGKVDRRALASLSIARSDLQQTFIPPRDSVELQLVEIWEDVLDIRPIGVQDNFFDLGGHSLLAVRLIAQIQAKIGQRIPLTTLFEAPTVERMAIAIDQDQSSLSWSPLVKIQSRGSQRPFFCIPGGGGNVIYLYNLERRSSRRY